MAIGANLTKRDQMLISPPCWQSPSPAHTDISCTCRSAPSSRRSSSTSKCSTRRTRRQGGSRERKRREAEGTGALHTRPSLKVLQPARADGQRSSRAARERFDRGAPRWTRPRLGRADARPRRRAVRHLSLQGLGEGWVSRARRVPDQRRFAEPHRRACCARREAAVRSDKKKARPKDGESTARHRFPDPDLHRTSGDIRRVRPFRRSELMKTNRTFGAALRARARRRRRRGRHRCGMRRPPAKPAVVQRRFEHDHRSATRIAAVQTAPASACAWPHRSPRHRKS